MYTNRRRIRAHVSNHSVMRDATTETRDLCVSVLRVGTSRLCVSHVVIALGAQLVGDAPPCLMSTPPSVYCGPDRATGRRHRGPGSRVLPLRNNSKFDKSHKFCAKPLDLL
jgi:hypothetical protein